ncbi:MAG: hypothetical protein U0792_02740 [Gemmataceae bacterium]
MSRSAAVRAAAGFEILADTSIRLWRLGPTKLSWEDAGGDRERHEEFTLHIRPHEAKPKPKPKTESQMEPYRNPLRPPATQLLEGFPKFGMYVVTYEANADSLVSTLTSIRESDWGEEPKLLMQPSDWPVSRENGSRNYKRALEVAAGDGCDFALILEDDVRVNRHLRHNLLANPLVLRDQCDYLGLFIPGHPGCRRLGTP